MEPALPLKMDLDRPILPRYGMLDQYHYEIIPLNSDAYSAIRYENRPTGPIPSLMLDLEVYTGAIDDFDFEDYLNVSTPQILENPRCSNQLTSTTTSWKLGLVSPKAQLNQVPCRSKQFILYNAIKVLKLDSTCMFVQPNAGEMILAAPSSSSGTKTLVESFNNKSAETEPSDVKLGLDLVSSMKEELDLGRNAPKYFRVDFSPKDHTVCLEFGILSREFNRAHLRDGDKEKFTLKNVHKSKQGEEASLPTLINLNKRDIN
ncbi:proteasome maturation factor [Arabidopsis thaliana]|uniref:Proteasome maturation factor n=1 Tax=Arabidopsis thaliana TaxID=3702 RepID=F4I0E9_ARATH|nr:proteasome maturation factor [Arabidopsis thaliana]AEE34022.1 proteasome maturation factor [Arabidopsis thaliana]|eukprot:NP_176480.1 proteasome maturation factor [Arabidopsis thaliana]